MLEDHKHNPEVQPRPERRRFTAEYKRRIVAEAEQCQHGELGSLLRREGLTYAQISQWRVAHAYVVGWMIAEIESSALAKHLIAATAYKQGIQPPARR